MDIYTVGMVPRALAAIGVVSTFVEAFWFEKGGFGYRASANGSVQHVAASTTPFALISALIGIGLLFVLMRQELQVKDFAISPLWRRYAALLIDFWFVVYILASISTMVSLLLEALRMNSFRWHFERDYGVGTDLVMLILILAGLLALTAYFVLPLANRRLTLGFWILRIATVSPDGSVLCLPLRLAFRRAYADFDELSSPLSLWRAAKGRDSQGRTRQDRETGFIVVRY